MGFLFGPFRKIIIDIRNYDKEEAFWKAHWYSSWFSGVYGQTEENFFFKNPVANSEDLLWMNVKHENWKTVWFIDDMILFRKELNKYGLEFRM